MTQNVEVIGLERRTMNSSFLTLSSIFRQQCCSCGNLYGRIVFRNH
jgi:hypothetical protein